MKYVVSVCVFLTLSVVAFAQRPEPGQVQPMPGEAQPDATGQRLQSLLKAAHEFERAGNVQEAVAARRQADLERQALLRRLGALQAESDMIRKAIGSDAQVLVHLQVFEVSVTKLKRLGYDYSMISGNSAITSAPGSTPNGGAFSLLDGGTAIEQLLEALRKDNLIKAIAEPTIVSASGRQAVFHHGDEFSIPVPQADGSTAILHRHGIEIELTPEVEGDKVRLTIHGRMSEVDPAHTVQAGNQTIPGVRTAEFATRTEVQNGRTVTFRGPTQVREEAEASGVPYVSEIPYVGAAFRKVKTTQNEIITLVVVRPEIVQTLPAGNPPVIGSQPMRFTPTR